MFGKSKLLQVQAFLILSDCSVPISKLPQLVYETKQDLQRLGLVSIVLGHVGDGWYPHPSHVSSLSSTT